MTTSDSSEAKTPSEEVIDFSETIERLERRAKRARRRVVTIGSLLVVSVLIAFFATLMSGVFAETERLVEIAHSRVLDRESSLESTLERRVSLLMIELIGSEPKSDQTTEIRSQLKEAFGDLERYKTIAEIGKTPTAVYDSSRVSSAIGSAVFSLGAVAFVVLLIQIAVSFMRYHTRLAELYEAQADALRASGGVADRAYAFMDHFSPNAIELGRAPTTLYEKALDTIKEVAKK